MTRTIKYGVVAVSILGFMGCGGGGGSSSGSANNNPTNGTNDPYKIVDVTYKLNGSAPVSCPGAYNISITRAQNSNDLGIQDCFWLCGSYQGASPVTVGLSFQQNGKDTPWEFESETIMTAPNQCHN